MSSYKPSTMTRAVETWSGWSPTRQEYVPASDCSAWQIFSFCFLPSIESWTCSEKCSSLSSLNQCTSASPFVSSTSSVARSPCVTVTSCMFVWIWGGSSTSLITNFYLNTIISYSYIKTMKSAHHLGSFPQFVIIFLLFGWACVMFKINTALSLKISKKL